MRFATPLQHEWKGWGDSSAAIVAMGLALAIAGLVQTLAVPTAQPVVAFELFVSLLIPTGLATGGYWLASQNVSSDVRWRVVIWVSVGIVAACGLGLWLLVYVSLEGGSIHGPLSLVTTLAAVGGATGFAAAVQVTPAIAPAGSTDSSPGLLVPENGTEPLTDSPRPEATEQSVDRSTKARERPTAAAVGATSASARDDTIPSESVATSDSASPAKTEAASTVWLDTDPDGRTAAPASPADPSLSVQPADSPVPTPERPSVSSRHEEPAAFPRPADSTGRDENDRVGNSTNSAERTVPALDPGVETVAGVSSTAETTLEILRKERARIALAVLYHEWDDEPRSVNQLARAVSYHTDDGVEAVEVGLRHATLPELQAIRAVDWDSYADAVSAPDHAVFEEGVREASILLESFEPGTR